MNAMPKLFDRVAGASENLRTIRDGAREKAVVAVRALEHRLVGALDGETLKGLREIGPGYQAARVRGKDPFDRLLAPPRIDPLHREQRQLDIARQAVRGVLVVTAGGALAMARLVGEDESGARVISRPAGDDDFLIEDVEALGLLFERILAKHIERARKSAEKFDRLAELAQQVSEALRG